MGDTRSPLTRNFVSTLGIDGINGVSSEVACGYYRNVYDIDDKIC